MIVCVSVGDPRLFDLNKEMSTDEKEKQTDTFTEVDELLLAVEKLMVIRGHSEEPGKTVMANVSRARKLLQLLELKQQKAELEASLARLQEQRAKNDHREAQLRALLEEPKPKRPRTDESTERMR